MFDRRRRLAAALLALPVWVSVLAFSTVSAPSAGASTVTTNTSCTNNAQPGTSSLPISVSGAAAPASVAVGDTITLAGATFGIDVPGAVLLSGYRLGLLSVGVNSIPATVNLTLIGTNTTEGSIALAPLSVTGTTTISDPTPAVKNSGDESALPLAVTAALPTTTWTATGGDVALRQGDSSTTALVGPGGFIAVTFACTPGNPAPAGCGAAPLAACTATDPVAAIAFSTVTITGEGSTTTSSSTSTTSTSTTSTSTTSTSTTSTTAPTSTTSTTGPTSTTSTTQPPVVPTKVSGTGTYTTTCTNSVTSDVSELVFTVSGSTMSPIEAGSTVSLTNQTWEVTVPGSVLQQGINLLLLHAGDSPTGTAVVSVFASNTKEGTITAAPVALSIGPIVVTAGLAQPAKTAFAVPDMSWTAVGGSVAYAMANASIEVEIGTAPASIKVQFTCSPKDATVTIVTGGVRGKTDIPAAKAGTEVLGATVTPAAAATAPLPRTGANTLVPLALAVGLIDLGYLLASLAQPARRRLRHLVQS